MEKAPNLKYTCKDCDFTWITLNGEHSICPKCHSENIEFIEEVKGLDIEAVLAHNKRRGGCCGSARGKCQTMLIRIFLIITIMIKRLVAAIMNRSYDGDI